MSTKSGWPITDPGFPAPRRQDEPSRMTARLLALHDRLTATDLRPGDDVDEAFGELVGLCCHPPEACIAPVLERLASHTDALRRLSSAGESNLERYWSARIARAADPWAELDGFPYLDNYRDLVRLELAALTAVGLPPPRRVVVLGSGPLPLTGLVLADRHGAEVLHVDRDADAVTAGDAVAAALGLAARGLVADLDRPIASALADELAAADTVLVGALVGADASGKHEITARLAAAAPQAALLVRSATGLRTLLYPEVPVADLPALDVLLEVHPRTAVVNSVLVARARR